MSLIPDIVESWRAPSRVVRRHLGRPKSEAFVFTFLFTFLFLAFVAQTPYAARLSHMHPELPLTQRLLATALGLMAMIPFWYGLAAVSRLVARVFGGQGSWYGARLALFWALAATGPLMLLLGLVEAMIGPGPQLLATRAVVGFAFLLLWLLMLHEEERG